MQTNIVFIVNRSFKLKRLVAKKRKCFQRLTLIKEIEMSSCLTQKNIKLNQIHLNLQVQYNKILAILFLPKKQIQTFIKSLKLNYQNF